ncbi:MAG: lysostaphin resistance A-like protein [Candidatus Udaeobacter sp.]
MKDVAKLAAYFIGIVIVGALLAPILFWSAQSLSAHGGFSFLSKYGFETFFHRSVLIAAALLLWPLLRFSHVRSMADLGLEHNPRWGRDVCAGVLLSAIPLLCCCALLVAFHVYSFRHTFAWTRLGKALVASITVPFIEEMFFRGIVLGVLLRTGRKYMAILAVSAVFAAVHFFKAPERTSAIVTWLSGFNSIAHSFGRVDDPTMLASAFATLFLFACILAVARVHTHSLWLPIGFHAGLIFASGTFSWLTHRQMVALPWLGKDLLVGIVPLCVAAITWIIVRTWLKYDRASSV